MKIAVIDDSSITLKVIELMLKQDGYIDSNDSLNTYISINSFLNDSKDIHQLDVISADYDLGKDSINGLEFLKNILSKGFKGICILLTGDDTNQLREKLMEYPMIHYVIKTATKDKSISTVAQLGDIINKTREKTHEY